MQSRFVDFIRKNNLLTEKDKILLGVSGGIDSMVMLHLFHKSGFEVSVAHCNFTLRNEESDGDEKLVNHVCELNGIKLYKNRFETEHFAISNKLSIQVAARNLRYDWFNRICNEFGYTKLAIAHNRDDVAETVLINLTRGTGLKGLTGIKAKNDNTIRPLLFAGRDEITRYAIQENIQYREDSSNSSVKYARNRIRHNVIPELENLNPSAKESIVTTARHVQEAWELVASYINTMKSKLVKIDNGKQFFSIQDLKEEPHAKFFLIEELMVFGFTPDAIEHIYDSLKGQPGKVFYSPTHQLLRDRDFLILAERKELDSLILDIEAGSELIDYPIKLRFKVIDNDESIKVVHDSNLATLDFEKLSFPMRLRPWLPGDKFMPFGMDNFKKVSDFLVDQKVSLFEKNNVYVLESGGDIVWVVGKRIDNRFKISDKTSKIWIANCLSEN
jgi:tRNA(Ile)-lysidine synthase